MKLDKLTFVAGSLMTFVLLSCSSDKVGSNSTKEVVAEAHEKVLDASETKVAERRPNLDEKEPAVFPQTVSTDMAERNSEFSQYVVDRQLVRLETNTQSLISSISKVIIAADRIFVFDGAADKLLVFDVEGKFLTRIGTKGGGPGEYLSLSDFDYDAGRQRLCILSRDQRAVLEYDVTGEFQRKVNLDFYPYNFAIFKEGFAFFISYYDSRNHNLLITDYDGHVVSKAFSFPEGTMDMHFKFTGNIVRTPVGVLYSDATSSRVFDIVSDLDLPKYQIDFSQESWPYDRRYDFQVFYSRMQKFELALLTSKYMENRNSFAFRFLEHQKFRNGFYVKGSGQFFIGGAHSAEFLPQILSVPVGFTEDGRFVSVIRSGIFQRFKSSYPDYSGSDSDIFDFVKDGRAEENPVLFIYDVRPLS